MIRYVHSDLLLVGDATDARNAKLLFDRQLKRSSMLPRTNKPPNYRARLFTAGFRCSMATVIDNNY
jgi:hypothetical protein